MTAVYLLHTEQRMGRQLRRQRPSVAKRREGKSSEEAAAQVGKAAGVCAAAQASQAAGAAPAVSSALCTREGTFVLCEEQNSVVLCFQSQAVSRANKKA